jgi:hypothetical protein
MNTHSDRKALSIDLVTPAPVTGGSMMFPQLSSSCIQFILYIAKDIPGTLKLSVVPFLFILISLPASNVGFVYCRFIWNSADAAFSDGLMITSRMSFPLALA